MPSDQPSIDALLAAAPTCPHVPICCEPCGEVYVNARLFDAHANAAKREVAEALIRAGCLSCWAGNKAFRESCDDVYLGWKHSDGIEHGRYDCDSSRIHELLHQLQEREDGD